MSPLTPFCALLACLVLSFAQYKTQAQPYATNNNDQTGEAVQKVIIAEPVNLAPYSDVEQIKAEEAYKKRQEEREISNTFWNKTGIIINTCLFFLVLVQAFLSFRQLKIMNRDLTQTKELFEFTERPALGIEFIDIDRRADEKIVIVGILVNTGKTVAKITKQDVFWDWPVVSGEPDAPEPGEPTPIIGRPVIQIGGRRKGPLGILEPSVWEEVLSRQRALLVWVRIEYKGLTERTYFMEHYSAYNARDGAFIEMPSHNDAD